MQRVEPLYSWTKEIFVLLSIVSLTADCATAARDLPQDYGSVDARARVRLNDFDAASLNLTCAEIDEELAILESDYALQARDITDKRVRNQAALYVGTVFFLPVLLLTDNSTEAKEKIRNVNRAKDELYRLLVFDDCPMRSSSQ